MAKKKKTQLKPVVRGFATTSVPKKKVEESEEVAPASGLCDTNDVGIFSKDEQILSQRLQQPSGCDAEKSPEEHQRFNDLVDRFQDRTEREITRTIKAIDQEKRFSDTLSRFELDASIIDRILALARKPGHDDSPKVINEPEEKALARLGVTFGVLRRLGFTEQRVEECLNAIKGIELDEAFEWLYIYCPENELDQSTSVNDPKPRTPKTPKHFDTPSSRRTLAPPTPTKSSGTSTPKQNGLDSRLNVKATEFVPSFKFSPATPTVTESETSVDSQPMSSRLESDVDRDAIKARILASFGQTDAEMDSSEIEDPNVEYVRLKLQITDLQMQGGQSGIDPAFMKTLQSRLEDVTKHYFFDQKDAEAQYRAEREKAQKASLRGRLRGDEAQQDSRPSKKESAPVAKLEMPIPGNITTDIFDDDDDVLNGGLFEILQEIPATETAENGTTIKVRDMALPKHWSGRTPKTLLSEVVLKSDRYAVISYSDISGSSRAKRAAVSVSWTRSESQDWAMEDIACHDIVQAENYIATVALHRLTFPLTEGFAAGVAVTTVGRTSFRLLPATFRDLWDELEEGRKENDNAMNRGVWAKLKNVLQSKLSTEQRLQDRNDRSVSLTVANLSRGAVINNDSSSEQIMAGFSARQASPAYQEMLQYRNQLPVARYRDEIVSTLESSQVLVLSGETGCGKSTQVPTFILEDQLSKGKHCKIYCTEPRRISAISLAQRVSAELGDPPGTVGTLSSLVGYSIRLESNTSRNTRLAFVTNGIALRMLESGSGAGGEGTAFDEITHIVIDEVHERSIESDFLLIVLRSLLEQRKDLKVILMSATVDADKIANYFGGCPTLHVPGRTFPVDVRYLEDAIELTQWSIDESSPYARRLHDKFYRSKARQDWSEEAVAGDEDDEEEGQANIKLERRYSSATATTINLLDERLIPYDLILRLLERVCFEDVECRSYSAAILVFMPGIGEIRRLTELLAEHSLFGSSDFQIFPLHSTISTENQGAVFNIPPPGVRKIVIATNIAETGITIPDITCVIDTGKHREMRYDEKRQISRLIESFVAKSNAAQRRGRAGRVQDGLCFHLFTKLRHDTLMADHPLPEIMRLSLSDLALRIKIMKIRLGSSIEDVLSRALDPPASVNIQRAVAALVEVRALTSSEEITAMGQLLSKLPTDVHLGKLLLMATLFRCLDPALTIAATLNSKSPFVTPFGLEQQADKAKRSFQSENSDFLTIHNAFNSWRSCAPSHVHKFCRTNFLSHQNLQQIEELRQQFLGYLVDSGFIQVDRSFVRDLSRARYGRNRTRFVVVPAEFNCNAQNSALISAALTAGLYPKLLAIDPSNWQMRTIGNNQPAAFHPSSVNFGRNPREFGVNYLNYFTLMHSKRLYAWETGPVDDVSILLLCGESDFKLISDSVFVDRKLKWRVSPKTNIALKVLRNNLASLLAQQFRGKPLLESQVLWHELGMAVLGKMKIEDEDAQQGPQTTISIVKHGSRSV
ncbi:P-loop containing nucleoside triphosphate hydrolase protein [Neolentinus lepideus HHB14362 ss-1]|uniref:RNA helicase n=1 Tax=Neolentinus lepideus HHB14362 ss-1 TaxID=1314782 RepID=A0A165W1I7_9AGAM|nr:P-loop containing nucleoside triphosphate hydrolase protein [Neolentinus lepideus HHB14362 ss-1]